jgi:hypothetical protein
MISACPCASGISLSAHPPHPHAVSDSQTRRPASAPTTVQSTPHRITGTSHSTLSFVKMMSAIVSAEALLRQSEKAMPTCEKSRSTVAELAGQPRYWRAITERFAESVLEVVALGALAGESEVGAGALDLAEELAREIATSVEAAVAPTEAAGALSSVSISTPTHRGAHCDSGQRATPSAAPSADPERDPASPPPGMPLARAQYGTTPSGPRKVVPESRDALQCARSRRLATLWRGVAAHSVTQPGGQPK